MAHELKFRYVYGIPGQSETYFFVNYKIDLIEYGLVLTDLEHFQKKIDDRVRIISRDQFVSKDNHDNDVFENDNVIFEVDWNDELLSVKWDDKESKFFMIDKNGQWYTGRISDTKLIGNAYNIDNQT